MRSKTPLQKSRAPRNRTLVVAPSEAAALRESIVFREDGPIGNGKNRIICGNAFEVLPQMSPASFDLLFADPPYNLSKKFGKESFSRTASDVYEAWLDSWLRLCAPLLKKTGSVYICGDWRSGAAIERAGSRYFKVRNRITWEREKGRGAKANWKNAAEDIWFFTVSDEYTFNLDAVKQRRHVRAPYRLNGKAKDWNEDGGYRDTHPANLWTDITVPFWSMPENTDHPTQKPEKLLAKIILASTNQGDAILDLFAGSGTAAVVGKKLGRDFVAIESDEAYCLLALKRLQCAEIDISIQGVGDGIFWERNSREAHARTE
ncbi:MAG: site-specific DNA-methyltransferase [Blastocatellia bacterium]|nr:site-specific DNA-methyltransferase [Blastocatellia bacterium]